MACTQRVQRDTLSRCLGAFHALMAVHFVDTDLQMIAVMDLNACLEDTRRVSMGVVCFLLCARVCVRVCDECVHWSAVDFFASVAFFFFSADNKESGKASFFTVVIPTGALAAVTVTLNCKHGNFFLSQWFSFYLIYLFGWWPILARLAVEA